VGKRGILVAVAAAVATACGSSGAPAESGSTAYRLRAVWTVDSPTHVTVAPGDRTRVFIVEQGGRIRVVLRGRLLSRPFLDITRLVRAGGEQGLLSVAFHPSYRRNGRFFVNYTDASRGDTRVVEYRANRSRTAALTRTARLLLHIRQPYANHNGGQLTFGPDGLLYVGMGDGGSGGDPENRAQNMASRLGKLLTLNVNARRPQPRIAALGLRNPWRFSFDRATGDLWIADVGQNAWEEIDYMPRQSAGLENYGWDVYEGRARHENKEPNAVGRLVFPVHVYRNGGSECSVTGGFVYRGRAIAQLRGRYIYGDYCSGRVWSLRIQNGEAVGNRLESFRVPQLSSFGEDASGELYAASLGGRVYKLVP
jgi:glucose/arabinose dehydrogenase